jgi:anthranilate phosphoribosyltransferase
MSQLRDILLKLCRRENLTRDEARNAFLHIMSGEAPEAQIGGLLVGLAAKGSTVEELVGAASVMREKCVALPVDGAGIVLDTCGTGGSKVRAAGIFNISTTAAIIAAAAGVKVAKHGNRSASSKSGSADALEALGVKLEVTPEGLRRCLDEASICFAFARSHHPAMKYVAPARTHLAIPTIFNMIGPLSSPAKVKHQLLGVFAPELTERFARVLKELGSLRAWVVYAEDGLDELSTMAVTQVSELTDGQVKTWTLDATTLGLPKAKVEDLQVADATGSAAAIRAIFAGEKGPKRDIAVLNAAAALVVAERCELLPEGIDLATKAIDSGAARHTLETLARLTHA